MANTSSDPVGMWRPSIVRASWERLRRRFGRVPRYPLNENEYKWLDEDDEEDDRG